MKISKLIDELYKELDRGDEEIFIANAEKDSAYYDFDLVIDENGQPLLIKNKFPGESS